MKLLLGILLSAAAPSAWATCNPDSDVPGSDVPCAVRSGQCSLSADIFLSAPDDSSAPQYVLEYGKFCGAGRKCPGLNNANEEADGRNIDVDACEDNKIDEACKAHDACLDIAGLPASEPVPPPVRCPCELAFVAKLAAVALGDYANRVTVDLSAVLGPLDGLLRSLGELADYAPPEAELCDDDFYDSPSLVGTAYADFLSLPIPSTPFTLSRSPEAVLLAAPFCGQFAQGGSCLEAEAVALYGQHYTVPVLGSLDADLGAVQGLCGIIINAISEL